MVDDTTSLDAEVYLNDKFVGTVENPQEFVDKVVSSRRKGGLSNAVNVRYDAKRHQVFIESDRGRVRRPLIVVKDGASLLLEKHLQQIEKNEITIADIIKQGVVEYLDSLEEENALV